MTWLRDSNTHLNKSEQELASPKERLVMSDLDTLTSAFKSLGIEFTIRINGNYQYLFIGERRDLYSMDGSKFNGFEDDDLDTVTMRHKFFEFENGELVSYPNS